MDQLLGWSHGLPDLPKPLRLRMLTEATAPCRKGIRRLIVSSTSRENALDHVVVVLFENRSLDNVLGHLYGPGDGKAFEGVIGKELSNPIPEWAEHGAEKKVVPYTV